MQLRLVEVLDDITPKDFKAVIRLEAEENLRSGREGNERERIQEM